MTVSQDDDSSFNSGGVADSMPSAKLLETRALKEAELARCVVDLAQANERLTVQVSSLQEQLHLARQASGGSTVNLEEMEGRFTARVTGLEKSLQSQEIASQERDELKQRVITLEQEKSDFLVDLSSLKEECAQLKSEVSDVNTNCESSIAGLKEQVGLLRITQGPLVWPSVKQYVWKSSGDASVSGDCGTELLQCPPMTSGVYKWTILVEDHSRFTGLGVASTVHSLRGNSWLGGQEGGWAYRSHGQAIHNNSEVKKNLPTFQKGSKVTFVLDLTGEGTLSAPLWMASPLTSYFRTCFP